VQSAVGVRREVMRVAASGMLSPGARYWFSPRSPKCLRQPRLVAILAYQVSRPWWRRHFSNQPGIEAGCASERERAYRKSPSSANAEVVATLDVDPVGRPVPVPSSGPRRRCRPSSDVGP